MFCRSRREWLPSFSHEPLTTPTALEATSEAIARIRRWKGKWELVTAGYRQRGGVVPRFRALLLSSLNGQQLQTYFRQCASTCLLIAWTWAKRLRRGTPFP